MLYCLCTLLDDYSCYVVHWEIQESMTEADAEVILQRASARAREKSPKARPRIITDSGLQFIAKSFQGIHPYLWYDARATSPYYPQSNGRIERWHKSLKSECIRPTTPFLVEDAQRVVRLFVAVYNTQRLHSTIGYITPQDKLEGREAIIFAGRKRKLAEAREARARRRQSVHSQKLPGPLLGGTQMGAAHAA